jgi:membrane-associated phospholipid phosphatase
LLQTKRVSGLLVLGAVLAAPLSSQTLDPPAPPDLGRFFPSDGSPEDGQRTLGAFPRNLGRGLVGVFSKDSLAPLLIGAAVSGGSSFLDTRTRSAVSSPASIFGNAGDTGGSFPVMAPIALGLFASGRLVGDGRFRAASYDITEALILSEVYTEVMKRAVHRTRPDGSDNYSFPSGHTSAAFAWATVANAHYGPKVGIPSYLVASAIGASRLVKDKHYLSDVLAGATLGYIVGRTVVRENGEPLARRTRVSLVPTSDAKGTGAGVGLSVEW